MTAPTRSFTEIAQRGQDSVAAAVRIWADLAQASVQVLTTGRSELLDGRRVADLVFGFANQVLDGQRALLSAVTATSNGRSAVAEVPALTSAAVETTTEVAEATPQATAEVAETASEATAEVAETVVEVVAGPYGKGSHAPLADRSEIPVGFEIKGNDGSKLYHVPGSSFYKRTLAEVWFATAEAAEAAGFLRPVSQR